MENNEKKAANNPNKPFEKRNPRIKPHAYRTRQVDNAHKADWIEIKKSHKSKRILKGVVKKVVSNGFIVHVLGWAAYLHNHEIPMDLKNHIKEGNKIDVVICKYQENDEGNRFWVSVTQALEKKEILGNLPIGTSFEGTVIEIVENGIIVNVNKLTGYVSTKDCPISTLIEWGVLCKKGTPLHVVVTNNKNSLMLKPDSEYYAKQKKEKKQASQDERYKQFREKLQPGISKCQATVTRISNFLVEIDVDGYKGFIEKDDLSWEWIKNPADEVFLGEEIDVLFDEEKDGKLYFSLKWQDVKLYVDEYYTADTETLLNVLGFQQNEFVGKVIDYNGHALAVSVMATGDEDYGKILVDPFTGKNLTVEVPGNYELTPQRFYSFCLQVSSEEERRKRQQPFSFDVYLENEATSLEEDPYKKEVERNFKLNENPKSNRETARLLKEIGADMYADRDRMFYELLQNADDAASLKGVQIKVQVKDDYLIFVHNGYPFSLMDFKSINSAANSTKPADSKKTGYKGIGFKSVFTDSQEVYIRTGGFRFKYDKGAPIFKDFDNFYSYVHDGDMTLFNNKYAEYKKEFKKVDDLPWQMLPFWEEQLPKELQDTIIKQYNNVAIALKVGIRAKTYEEKICKIMQSSKFMLFLRNTNRIQLEHEGRWLSLAVEKQDENIVELKSSMNQDCHINKYYINKLGCEIGTTNEDFIRCDIPIKKVCNKVGEQEKWSLYEITDRGDILVTSIPERIIEQDSTTISFAFKYDEVKGVTCNPKNALSLFAYLPMEDRRYILPFYVNADFELSSNRQEAKRNASWNQFLFYNIGRNLCKWVAEVAAESNPDYLSLIPSQWFVENLDEEKDDMLAKDFNRGFRESLETEAFILNDEDRIVKQDEILIDKSGFSKVINSNIFVNLLKTERRLPHPSLNCVYLDNHEIFSGIERIQFSQIRDIILDKKNLKRILTFWKNTTTEIRTNVLMWIAERAETDEKLSNALNRIPAFEINGELYSYRKILKNKLLCVLNNTTKPLKPILEKIGLVCSDYNISKHPLCSLLIKEQSMYNDVVFEKVSKASAEKAGTLSIQEKHLLFKRFTHRLSGINDEKISNWKLFSNRNGELCPLCKLTNIDSTQYANVIDCFSISETEYIEELEDYLIALQDIFKQVAYKNWEKLVGIALESESMMLALYKFVIDRFNEAQQRNAAGLEKCDFSGKKIVFSEGQMHNANNCFIHSAISEKETVRRIIRQLTGYHVPNHDVLECVKTMPFACKESTLSALTLEGTKSLSEEDTNELLDLCLKTGDSLLNKNWIANSEQGTYIMNPLPTHGCMAFTEDANLGDAITLWCPNIKLLPSELNAYRILPGICADDILLQKVIEYNHVIEDHTAFFLDYIEKATNSVKYAFIKKLSSVCISPTEIGKKDNIEYRILLLVDKLEQKSPDFFSNLREKIYVLINEQKILLSTIKAQRTVRIGNVDFPISKLMSEKDEQAAAVCTIMEKLKMSDLSENMIENIFKTEFDGEYAKDIFGQLNTKNNALSTGCQLAFVLTYAKEAKNVRLECLVETEANKKQLPILSTWYYKAPTFIKREHCLSATYNDIEAYLKIPFEWQNVVVTNKLIEYRHIQNNLSDEAQLQLLSHIYVNWKENLLPIKSENLQIAKEILGIDQNMIFAQIEYLLPEENLPAHIQQWLMSKNSTRRCEFANTILKIPNDTCSVIKFRKYLKDECTWVEGESLTNLMRMQICNWIEKNKLTLSTSQFITISEILTSEDFYVGVNEAQLKSYETFENRIFAFKDFIIYDCKESIPYDVRLIKNNRYVFHSYNEGNAWILGKNIFVNSQCIDTNEALKELTTSGKLSTEDYFDYIQTPKDPEYSAQLEGSLDCDLDEDKRIARSNLAKEEAKRWLLEHGYTIPNGIGNFTCFEARDKQGKIYPIVVKSLKDTLYVNPNEWIQLIKQNSRLMLYLRHGKIAVINRDQLLKSRDFLNLRIAKENFDKGDSLDERITKISECLQYFQRTHIVFEQLNSSNFYASKSLDDIGLYEYNEEINTSEDSLNDLQ